MTKLKGFMGGLAASHQVLAKVIYAIFSIGLLFLAITLFIAALRDYTEMFASPINVTNTFTAIILTTLAIALFDFAKTLFEEEVVLQKDTRRHSEVRRTLTRFVSSILIAISIEALLLVFKFAMTEPEKILYALALIIGVALLLLALGIYVYLGVKAETLYYQRLPESMKTDEIQENTSVDENK